MLPALNTKLLLSRLALIGIFVVAFLFGWQPYKSAVAIVPLAAENTSASCPQVIDVNDCTCEVQGASKESAPSRSAPHVEDECVIVGGFIGQFFIFTASKNPASQVIFTGRQERPERGFRVGNFSHNVAFNNCGAGTSCIHQSEPNFTIINVYLPQDYSWPVSLDQFKTREVDGSPSKPSLHATSECQNNSEKRDNDSSSSRGGFWRADHNWRSTFIITLLGLIGFAVIYGSILFYIVRDRHGNHRCRY